MVFFGFNRYRGVAKTGGGPCDRRFDCTKDVIVYPRGFGASFYTRSFYTLWIRSNIASLRRACCHRMGGPGPIFAPHRNTKALGFYRGLVRGTINFASHFSFTVRITRTHSHNLHQHVPPMLHHQTVSTLLRKLYFRCSPLTGHIRYSVAALTVRYKLTARSNTKGLSVAQTAQTLAFLSRLKLVACRARCSPLVKYCVPASVAFASTLFTTLSMSRRTITTTHHDHIR